MKSLYTEVFIVRVLGTRVSIFLGYIYLYYGFPSWPFARVIFKTTIFRI